MLIQRDQMVVGLPAVQVREALRILDRVAHTERAFDRLAPEGVSGAAFFQRLQDEGYLRTATGMPMQVRDPEDYQRNPPYWSTSVKGTALAKARIGRPMTRAKAETIAADFLHRVVEVNADPGGIYWIEWVDLFGSLADRSCATVGDVDLNVLAVGRYPGQEQFDQEKKRASQAMAAGRHLPTLISQLGYAQDELRRVLRNRSSLIDLQLDFGRARPLPVGATTVRIYERATTG